eukprot:Skav210203  [mRNA]  locus=scaffold3141:34356:52856:+ [translate_table: standard]
MLALPFGSVRSVHSFLRIAHSIWFVCSKLFHILWCNFFDDFVTIAPQCDVRSVTLTIETVLQLLGWTFAQDGKKAPPFASSCTALGVVIDLSHMHLGSVSIDNTPSRKSELSSTISEILDAGSLSKQGALQLRGRMQFSAGQFFGRVARACLGAVTRHAYDSVTAELSSGTIMCLSVYHQILLSDKPRVLSLSGADTWMFFTDACYEPEESGPFAGLGGVLINPAGQIHRFFSHKLTQEHLEALNPKKARTLIFECEFLAVYLALRLQFWLKICAVHQQLLSLTKALFVCIKGLNFPMPAHKVLSLSLALFWRRVTAEPDAQTLLGDDQCAGAGQCAFSALQRRGAKVAEEQDAAAAESLESLPNLEQLDEEVHVNYTHLQSMGCFAKPEEYRLSWRAAGHDFFDQFTFVISISGSGSAILKIGDLVPTGDPGAPYKRNSVMIHSNYEIVLNIALCGDWAGNGWFRSGEARRTGFTHGCGPLIFEPTKDCCSRFATSRDHRIEDMFRTVMQETHFKQVASSSGEVSYFIELLKGGQLQFSKGEAQNAKSERCTVTCESCSCFGSLSFPPCERGEEGVVAWMDGYKASEPSVEEWQQTVDELKQVNQTIEELKEELQQFEARRNLIANREALLRQRLAARGQVLTPTGAASTRGSDASEAEASPSREPIIFNLDDDGAALPKLTRPTSLEDWEQGLEMLNTAQTRDRQASLRHAEEGTGQIRGATMSFAFFLHFSVRSELFWFGWLGRAHWLLSGKNAANSPVQKR